MDVITYIRGKVRRFIQSQHKPKVTNTLWVYVIGNYQYPGKYKVGISSNLKARLSQYQTADPCRGYKVKYKKLTPLAKKIERYIHLKYRANYEWVEGDLQSIIKDIKQYKEKI